MSVAISRYHTAKGYFQVAIMAWRHPEQNENRRVMSLLPLANLMGFSLELYLKAWILESGKTPKEVRSYGHKITTLYNDSLQAGLPKINGLDEVVTSLSTGHESYMFRYIEDDNSVPNFVWENIFAVFNELDTHVDAFVGASASVGLKPGH